MSASFVIGGVDPISRSRRCISDTRVEGAEPIFEDERYYGWLEGRLSLESLWFFMPSTNVLGNTTAAVKIYMGTEDPIPNLIFELTHDVSATASIVLAPDIQPGVIAHKVGELVEQVLRLDYGWEVGLDGSGGMNGLVEWVTNSDIARWGHVAAMVSDPATESLAMIGQASMLALTGRIGTEQAIDCVGTSWEKDAKQFRFYQFAQAGLQGLEDIQMRGAPRAVKSRREGNVAKVFSDMSDVRERLESKAGDGLYGGAW